MTRTSRNRRERRAIVRGLYRAASWALADHYARLARWAFREVAQGRAVNFS